MTVEKFGLEITILTKRLFDKYDCLNKIKIKIGQSKNTIMKKVIKNNEERI
jgi:hypothetical protein